MKLFSESLPLYWPCLKRYIYEIHEKATLGNVVSVNCYIFYLLLNFWKHFVSMTCFYTWNFPTILGYRFFILQFHHHLYIYQQFVYLACMGILNTSLPLQGPYIYNIFMVCNNILFSILTRNTFPAPLLVILGNTVFFHRYNILDKYYWRCNR